MITEEWIRIKCESCNARVKAPLKFVGKKGKCPKCGKINIIPEPEKDDFDKILEEEFSKVDTKNAQINKEIEDEIDIEKDMEELERKMGYR
jgi:predicted RNA-binding Zn-ribbon protein involved in translation (DUF1610 family)